MLFPSRYNNASAIGIDSLQERPMKMKANVLVTLLVGWSVVALTACTGIGGGGGENPLNVLSGGGKGCILHQTGQFTGDQTVYITPDSAKVVNELVGITYIVKNGGKEIAIFSDKKKLCLLTNFEKLHQEHLQRKKLIDEVQAARGEKETPFEKGKTENIAGLNATEYFSVEPASDGEGKGTRSEIWITDDVKSPENFSKLQSTRVSGLPSRGIPLRMVVDIGDGEPVKSLDTVKVEKDVDIPASTFEIPKGYTAASSEMEVVTGEGSIHTVDKVDPEDSSSGAGAGSTSNADSSPPEASESSGSGSSSDETSKSNGESASEDEKKEGAENTE